jgi:2-oxo-4-hydroxy-4-carboxy-5-ureidoimidazoline decarboxylase
MNQVLSEWNVLPQADAAATLLDCCGSPAWAKILTSGRPFPDEGALLQAADRAWRQLSPVEWREAFHSHPRIGESKPQTIVPALSAAWSAQEQGAVSTAGAQEKSVLAEANRAYEQKFGYIFIVCATGKSVAEVLEILRCRMHNDADSELREAAEQQRQIMQLRLKKWLAR